MKIASLLIMLSLGIPVSGCCSNIGRVEPVRPEKVSGWQTRQERGLTILGDFVLRKGESTTDGRLQVRVVDLLPPDSCAEAGSFQRQARAGIQLIRLSDNLILFDNLVAERGSMAVTGSENRAGILHVGTIYISDINLTEGWVRLELRG